MINLEPISDPKEAKETQKAHFLVITHKILTFPSDLVENLR